MDVLLDELSASFADGREALRVALRLVAAMVAGMCIGMQRERIGKAAGLRTHMLVCTGTAVFVLAGTLSGMESDALSRIIQGLTTGIGFLGAGTIIKIENAQRIHGLTTAAGIWMTAAIGVLAGLGLLATAAMATVCAWVVLAVVWKVEQRVDGSDDLA